MSKEATISFRTSQLFKDAVNNFCRKHQVSVEEFFYSLAKKYHNEIIPEIEALKTERAKAEEKKAAEIKRISEYERPANNS